MNTKLDSIFKTMVQAVTSACAAIMKIYKSSFSVNYKEDNSPVTNADLESNKIITSYLNKFNIKILSEEVQDDFSRLNKSEIFILDPLDGTQDFVNRDDSFGVNLAYVVNGKPLIGIVGLPCEKGYAYAIKDEGAYLVKNNHKERLYVSNRDDNLIFIGSKTHPIKEEIALYNNPHISKVITSGASTKAVLLSSGKADVSIRLTNLTKEWDVVSSNILVEEAGGYFITTKGKEFTYNKKDIVNNDGYIMINKKENLKYFKY